MIATRSIALLLVALFAHQSWAFATSSKAFRPSTSTAFFREPPAPPRTALTMVGGMLGDAAEMLRDAAELKAPPDLYQAAVTTGTKKGKSSIKNIFILGLLAGCHIGFGAFLAVSVAGNCPGILADNPGLQKFLMGAVGLPSGLIMTLASGAELFTGNTALVTAANREGKITNGDLAKNWIVSYIGNLVGSIVLAYFCYKAGTLGASPGAVNVATAKCSMPWDVAFIRGILGNWIVCMAVYLANGCNSLPGKMTSVFFLISAFVAMGFDHSVANMFFIPLGIFRGAKITWAQMFTKNLIPVSLGNIIGGALCVMMPYGVTLGGWLDKKEDGWLDKKKD